MVQAHFQHAVAKNLTGIEDASDGMTSLVHRLTTKGPDGMEFIDFVFLGCVVILGLEFVNFLVKQSGCK